MRSFEEIQDEIDSIHRKIMENYTPEVIVESQPLLDALHAEREEAFKAWVDQQLAEIRSS